MHATVASTARVSSAFFGLFDVTGAAFGVVPYAMALTVVAGRNEAVTELEGPKF